MNFYRVGGVLSPDMILEAYTKGFFPMAESKKGPIYWHSPDPRAVFPLPDLKPSRSLRQYLNKAGYSITFDKAFERVMRACADRNETWINDDIISTYTELNSTHNAHSVETWHDGELIGGLYGVVIGGAFFGESMFHYKTNASKAAFYALVARLQEKKFLLLDSQYLNSHTKSLGAVEVPRRLYLVLLQAAIFKPCSFGEV